MPQLAAGLSDDEATEQLFLTTLSRRPTPAETAIVQQHIQTTGDRAAAFFDMQHALLNSNEFLWFIRRKHAQL